MIKFTAAQLIDMLRLQNTLNTITNGPLWREKKFAWHRAAWHEAGELIEHIGWKWWKKQEPDLAQAQLEVVDIWHFAMSYALEQTFFTHQSDDVLIVADAIRNDMALAENSLTFGFEAQTKMVGEIEALHNLIEILVEQAAGDKQVSPAVTLELGERLGLTADTMYKLYLGKNLINIFRQEYGYKEGLYQKVWRGLEDNQVLVELMKAYPDWTSEELYAELRLNYGRPVPTDEEKQLAVARFAANA